MPTDKLAAQLGHRKPPSPLPQHSPFIIKYLNPRHRPAHHSAPHTFPTPHPSAPSASAPSSPTQPRPRQMNDLPPSLKSIGKYLARAREFENQNPVVSYYCTLYSLRRAMQLNKREPHRDDPATSQYIKRLLEKCEITKSMLPPDDGSTHLQAVQNLALNIFEQADSVDRAERATKDTALAFFAAMCLFEVCTEFGPLSDDLSTRLTYSRIKAGDITKALKEGRRPAPGPPSNAKNPTAQPDPAHHNNQVTAEAPVPKPEPSPNSRFTDPVPPAPPSREYDSDLQEYQPNRASDAADNPPKLTTLYPNNVDKNQNAHNDHVQHAPKQQHQQDLAAQFDGALGLHKPDKPPSPPALQLPGMQPAADPGPPPAHQQAHPPPQSQPLQHQPPQHQPPPQHAHMPVQPQHPPVSQTPGLLQPPAHSDHAPQQQLQQPPHAQPPHQHAQQQQQPHQQQPHQQPPQMPPASQQRQQVHHGQQPQQQGMAPVQPLPPNVNPFASFSAPQPHGAHIVNNMMQRHNVVIPGGPVIPGAPPGMSVGLSTGAMQGPPQGLPPVAPTLPAPPPGLAPPGNPMSLQPPPGMPPPSMPQPVPGTQSLPGQVPASMGMQGPVPTSLPAGVPDPNSQWYGGHQHYQPSMSEMQDAQRYARNAVSALDFRDLQTAIHDLEKALGFLRGTCKS